MKKLSVYKLVSAFFLLAALVACNDRMPAAPENDNNETPPPPAGSVCGNGTCEASENEITCEEDCGIVVVPPPPVCGNGACESGETTASCAADCPATSSCGNGVCDAGETATSCAADCPSTPPVSTFPSIVSFTVNSSCVSPNEMFTLSWQTQNTDQVQIDGNRVNASGQWMTNIPSSRVFTLRAFKGNQIASRTLWVNTRTATSSVGATSVPFTLGAVDAVSASRDGTTLVLSGSAIYKGTVGGNFARVNPNPLIPSWLEIAIDPQNSSILYAATTGSLYRSADGGATWNVYFLRRNNSNVEPLAIYPSPTIANHVYVPFSGGVFRVDLGLGHPVLLPGLNFSAVREMIYHFVASPPKLLAAGTEKIYTPTNGTWNALSTPDWGTIHSLNAWNGKFYVSAENGLYSAPWNLAGSWSQEMPGLVLATAESGGQFYALTSEGVMTQAASGWTLVKGLDADWILPASTLPTVASASGFQSLVRQTNPGVCPVQAEPMFDDVPNADTPLGQ